MLGVLRRPAWQASLAGLIVGLVIAVGVWSLPVGLALDSVFNGIVLALWPVMWIVVNALLLYNIAVRSGRFESFRAWLVNHLPDDRRVVLVIIGFCFGALLEGIAGFGTPVAITSSLLILMGFPPLEALVFVLIFNTAPVAFGALGVPVTVLGAVTGLPATALGAMVGRQLPVMALILPFYVMFALWRHAIAARAVADAAGRRRQFRDLPIRRLELSSTTLLPTCSLRSARWSSRLLFLQVWRPAPDPEFVVQHPAVSGRKRLDVAGLARLVAVAHRLGGGHRLDVVQDRRHRTGEAPLAGVAQRHLDHALRQQALCGGLDVRAAGHGNRHSPFRRS